MTAVHFLSNAMLTLKKNLLNIREVVLIIVFLMPNKGSLYLALENIMLV